MSETQDSIVDPRGDAGNQEQAEKIRHQLCWAHLIRKAIKLALQNPDEIEYAEFLDVLCSIYDDAKQLRNDHQRATNAAKSSKSEKGAKRRGVIVAVLARLCLKIFRGIIPGWHALAKRGHVGDSMATQATPCHPRSGFQTKPSLQTRISAFTLSNVMAEVDHWLESGISLFQHELQAFQADHPPPDPVT